jgi:hypothetical protein
MTVGDTNDLIILSVPFGFADLSDCDDGRFILISRQKVAPLNSFPPLLS